MFAGAPARVAWLLPFTTVYLQAYELLKKRVAASKKDKHVVQVHTQGQAWQ
jgi:hypothetical protein